MKVLYRMGSYILDTLDSNGVQLLPNSMERKTVNIYHHSNYINLFLSLFIINI